MFPASQCLFNTEIPFYLTILLNIDILVYPILKYVFPIFFILFQVFLSCFILLFCPISPYSFTACCPTALPHFNTRSPPVSFPFIPFFLI